MQARAVVEWLGFQLVWLACAFGAVAGLNWPGVLATVAFLFVVWLLGRRQRADVAGVLVSGGTGALVETGLTASGLVAYAAASAGPLAPPWIIALWLAFGATLPAFEGMLGKRSWIWPVALGLLGAPLSYLAGARMGALDFPAGTLPALAVLGVAWGLALPLLLTLRRNLNR